MRVKEGDDRCGGVAGTSEHSAVQLQNTKDSSELVPSRKSKISQCILVQDFLAGQKGCYNFWLSGNTFMAFSHVLF